jgi:hypothetical protein
MCSDLPQAPQPVRCTFKMEPQPPNLSFPHPNTTLPIPIKERAPAHMMQGSTVTYNVQLRIVYCISLISWSCISKDINFRTVHDNCIEKLCEIKIGFEGVLYRTFNQFEILEDVFCFRKTLRHVAVPQQYLLKSALTASPSCWSKTSSMAWNSACRVPCRNKEYRSTLLLCYCWSPLQWTILKLNLCFILQLVLSTRPICLLIGSLNLRS